MGLCPLTESHSVYSDINMPYNQLTPYTFSIMSKDSLKKSIIDYRTKITKEREQKKRDNEYYARLIKSTTSASSKASYRKNKIDKAAYHDRCIENYKKQIEYLKDRLKREK